VTVLAGLAVGADSSGFGIMTSVMTVTRVEARNVGPLASSPLRLAIVQARTTPVLAFEQPAEVQRLADVLAGRWTVTDRQANREIAYSLGPAGVNRQAGPPETVWVLSATDGATRAALSASSVTVECDRYEAWERFHAAIRDIFDTVARTFAPAQCTRLGVRYINELNVGRAGSDPTALAELVNPALIAPVMALGRPLLGSLAELRVAEDDGAEFVVRHGLTAGDYLLDLDAYREQAEAFDAAALAERADRFHARIGAVFAWALTDRYLDELRSGAGEGTP
jgi:uncharacterized protein (TIGR04255 family)